MPRVPPVDPAEVAIATALGLNLERVVAGSLETTDLGDGEALVEWTEWTEEDRMVPRASTALTWAQLEAITRGDTPSV